jgi:hypothetical protein
MIVSWQALKAVLVGRNIDVHGTEDTENYYLMAVDGALIFTCTLSKRNLNDDLADFEINYKPTWNPRVQPMINGYPMTRPATTRPGWHYNPRYLTWTTAKYGSLHNMKADAVTDWGDATLRFFQANGTELLRSDYLSDLLFQAALDLLCARTALDWHSTFDFDIVGNVFLNGTRPSNPTWGYVIGAPDIPAFAGGNVPFLDGGFPLHLLNEYSLIDFHGITVKTVIADAVYKSNKFRLLVDHGTTLGLQQSLSMGFKKFNL